MDWSALSGLTGDDLLKQAASSLWGQAGKQPSEAEYFQQVSDKFPSGINPNTWGETAPMSWDQLLATKGTDYTSGSTDLLNNSGDYTSPYTTFQNMFKQYIQDNPAYYSGTGAINEITGDGEALSGAGMQVSPDMSVLAQNLVNQFSMDGNNVYPRYGDLGGNFSNIISALQPYSGNKLNIAPEGYGEAYDIRKSIMDSDRRAQAGGGLEGMLNNSSLVPLVGTFRSFADAMTNSNYNLWDRIAKGGGNIVAPDMQSVGETVAPEIYKVMPPAVQQYGAALAPLIGALVGGVPGVMGAELIKSMSIPGESGGRSQWLESPGNSATGALVKGGAAYVGSELADLMSGLSSADLMSAIDNAQNIRAAGQAAGELPTKITPEMYDAMFGGIERGTMLGDLQGAYADVATDLSGLPKLSTAETEYINDTQNWPGYNTPAGGAIDTTKMSEADLIKAEAERDAALQGLNPLEGTQGGGGSTGDLQLDEELAMDAAEFAQSENEVQDLQSLEESMKEPNLFDDIDWKKLGEGGMKLLNSMFGGGQDVSPDMAKAIFSTWGPNPRRGGGGIMGEGAGDEGTRMSKFKRSRDDAGEAGSEWHDLLGLLNPDLKEYVRMAAMREE